MERRAARVLLVAALLVAGAAAAASQLSAPPADEQPVNVFSTPLADDAPLAGDSREVVRRLAAQARYTPDTRPVAGYYPEGFNAIVKEDEYSVPVYVVGAAQPRSRVVWVDDEGRPHPAGSAQDLQATLDQVPLPLDVQQLQADGNDGHLVVHQPSTDTLWEFWRFRARPGADGGNEFVAGYGARISQWSQSSGVLPHQWGARATSLALLGGVMRMEDFRRGSFPYALTMAVPVISDEVVPPATRTDGPSSATPSRDMRDAVSAGMRFRLPPDHDCAGQDALLAMVCTAVRDYGLVVSDRSGGTLTLYAEDDRTVGTPYSATTTSPWPGLEDRFSGRSAVLSDFPWQDLQLLAPMTP